MIAATPVDGSHYFSDVAAGLTIAALSWIGVQQILNPIPDHLSSRRTGSANE
jgi:membrane-associated phospholipid phosphatase